MDGKFAPPERAVEVADRIYAYVQPDGSWWINDTGFLVAADDVISVDACSTVDRTRAYRNTTSRSRPDTHELEDHGMRARRAASHRPLRSPR